MAEQTPTVQQLCDAAQAGDLAQVEEILAQNALLARQPITQNGQLAIQFAARRGVRRDSCRALSCRGRPPGAARTPNRRATSALAYARARGYSKIVALIEGLPRSATSYRTGHRARASALCGCRGQRPRSSPRPAGCRSNPRRPPVSSAHRRCGKRLCRDGSPTPRPRGRPRCPRRSRPRR